MNDTTQGPVRSNQEPIGTLTAIPQGTLLFPKAPFTATVGPATIKAFPGEGFWVTNSSVNQRQTGIAMIARSGSRIGWPFSLVDARNLFDVNVEAGR